jgi:antitoxin component of RelBE/YafQ-DinJ toxin-antitoxin module
MCFPQKLGIIRPTQKCTSHNEATLRQAEVCFVRHRAGNIFFYSLLSFGIDSATAIRMFFTKVVETGRIPFTIGYDAEDLYGGVRIAEMAYKDYEESGKNRALFLNFSKNLFMIYCLETTLKFDKQLKKLDKVV